MRVVLWLTAGTSSGGRVCMSNACRAEQRLAARRNGERALARQVDRLTGGRPRRAWAARALARRRARRARARAPASAAPASTLSWCTSCCSAHVRATSVPASQRRARSLSWRLCC